MAPNQNKQENEPPSVSGGGPGFLARGYYASVPQEAARLYWQRRARLSIAETKAMLPKVIQGASLPLDMNAILLRSVGRRAETVFVLARLYGLN